MENAQDTMILDQATFSGLTACTKSKALEVIWFDWKFAVEDAHEARLQMFDEKNEDEKEELKQTARHHTVRAKALKMAIHRIMAYNAKGDIDPARSDSASDALRATESDFELKAQKAYWERQEAKKEEALKAEYMAGFDAWKATQASA